MIDLHTHVLPGIDDGPSDLAGAVELARAAAEGGTIALAATPHVRPDHPAVHPGELAGRVQIVSDAIDAAGIRLQVVPGGEVDLLWAQQAGDEALREVSYGQRGRDLLVETPYGSLPVHLEDMLFNLRARGYRVLLAHPERNRGFQRDHRRLAALVAGGTLLQVTAVSLASDKRSSRSRRLALDLVRHGLAHVIASDAHGPLLPRASLRDGVEAAERVAPARARWMVTDAPAAILAGEPLPEAPAGRSGLRRAAWLRRG